MNNTVYKIKKKTKNLFYCFISSCFPVLYSKMLYKRYIGKKLNLTDPETLNEKLMYLKLNVYKDDPEVYNCADKYAVRKRIEDLGLSHILVKLYGVYERAEDVDFDALPDKFVLKCNHGCGFNILCRDKSAFDVAAARAKLERWMKKGFGARTGEQGIYRKIKRRIIAEEFIETSDGEPPKDYKFFCSYGKVKMIFVASDRASGEKKINYYYPDWTKIDVKRRGIDNSADIPRPENLDEMIRCAEIISKKYPILRVDLYNENGKIYFGEMTFTHCSCKGKYEPDSFDLLFGKMFPDKKEIDERGIEKDDKDD